MLFQLEEPFVLFCCLFSLYVTTGWTRDVRGGAGGRRADRHFVFGRFRPLRSLRDEVGRCKLDPSLTLATCFQPLNLRLHTVLST